MALRTVLIDVGGTLIEEDPPRPEIYAAAARSRGRPVSAARMARSMGAAHDALPLEVAGSFRYSDPWFEAFMEHIFHRDLGIERAALPGISAELFERFSDPATFRVLPDARAFLEELSALGLGAVAVSNWSGRLAGLLDALGLAAYLDAVVVSAEERCEKPSPELFQRALDRCGTLPQDALHAGDKPLEDIAGARAAGIEAVLLDHHGRLRDLDLPRVESFAELGRWVRERLA